MKKLEPLWVPKIDWVRVEAAMERNRSCPWWTSIVSRKYRWVFWL